MVDTISLNGVEVKAAETETLKLYKNETSKGVISYSWDIKLLGDVNTKRIERLKLLNESMKTTFCAEV